VANDVSPAAAALDEPTSMDRRDDERCCRVATLNILADCFPLFIEMAIRSRERYEGLCQCLTVLDGTVVALNEVTPTALKQLERCSFIRENYFITDTSTNERVARRGSSSTTANKLVSPHGSLLLSKRPLLELFAIGVTGSRREALVAKIRLSDRSDRCAYFCAQHTTAHQTQKNAQLRAQQVRDIVDALTPLGLPFVLMGDLNLHYPFEDRVIVDNRLVDAWAQTHFSSRHPFDDHRPGYTFDAIDNTFINCYIPGERRQMRLDRILFSRGFPALAVAPCALWANQRLDNGSHLFVSDHFGLFIDIAVDNDANDGRATMPLSEPDAAVDEHLCRNAHSNESAGAAYRLPYVRTALAMTRHAVWLTAVALGLK
jgi:endonuclease/exonuclease/phosphatase family metal-dependent hydrolase